VARASRKQGAKGSVLSGVMGKRLSTEGFYGLATTLSTWRIDPEIKLMDDEADEGRILGFVKGLRLSAQVAYLVRDLVSKFGIEANWGHLIDDQGKSCSPECDVILHRPGQLRRWNGGEKPIMDFRFVECDEALGVISFKSYVRSVDNGYCNSLKKYKIGDVWLFGECCETKSADTLTKNARRAGYRGFVYLYSIGEDGFSLHYPENLYLEFIDDVVRLASTAK